MSKEIDEIEDYFDNDSFFHNDNWKEWNKGIKYQKNVRDDGSLRNGVKKWHGFDNER